MKRFHFYTLLFFIGYFFAGCSPIEIDDNKDKDDDGGTITTPDVITEDAISVDSLLHSTANDQLVFVEGRVIGYVNSTRMSTSSLRFEDVNSECTNLVLASNKNETNIARMIPVQISQKYRGSYKLGTLLAVLGTYTTYYGKKGIKNCDLEIVDETSIVTPEDTTTTTTPSNPTRTVIYYNSKASNYGNAR